MNALKYILIFLWGVTLQSCSDSKAFKLDTSINKEVNEERDTTKKGKLAPLDYVQWIEREENGLRVEKKIGDYTFRVQYKPLEYIALKEDRIMDAKKEAVEKSMSERNEFQYCTFQIGLKDGAIDPLEVHKGNADEYQKWIEYFSFKMQSHLKLVEAGDTLNCVLHHFERTYGISPYSTFVLGFELGKNKTCDKTFFYDDQLLGVGPLKIIIKAEDLLNIPQLALN